MRNSLQGTKAVRYEQTVKILKRHYLISGEALQCVFLVYQI